MSFEGLERVINSMVVAGDLSSLLCYGTDYDVLDTAGRLLAERLRPIVGAVDVAHVSPADDEDQLYGFVLREVPILRGKLTPPKGETRVVIISDLGRSSLAVQRACVELIGAEVMHLERHGQRRTLRPRLFWIAGLARSEIGRVSPHLLDRFEIRAEFAPAETNTIAALRASLTRETRAPACPTIDLSGASRRQVAVDPELCRYVVAEVDDRTRQPGMRNVIRVARLARAFAKLDLQAPSKVHVDQALAVLDFARVPKTAVQAPLPAPEPTSPPRSDHGTGPMRPAVDSTRPPSTDPAPIVEPKNTSVFDVEPEPPLPLQERDAPVEREMASLAIPRTRASAGTGGRGEIVGTGRADRLVDFALVPTLIAALPFQRYRNGGSGSPLMIRREDLRSYRRAPRSESLWVVLFDATAVRDPRQLQALVPHLREAYQQRAELAVLIVGAKPTTNELRAEVVRGRSILVPAVTQALTRSAGTASPLADALDVARGLLMRALEVGPTRRAHLLVVTDGRGNVPLEWSRGRPRDGAVGRRGIDDALEAARAIAPLRRVERAVLDPLPTEMRELPRLLAHALDAKIIALPRGESG